MKHGNNTAADLDFNFVVNSCTFQCVPSPWSQKTYENKRRQVCVKVRKWEMGCESMSNAIVGFFFLNNTVHLSFPIEVIVMFHFVSKVLRKKKVGAKARLF